MANFEASLLESMDDPLERSRYRKMQKEIETDPHIQWGKNINVLIISDRCGGRAFGLYNFLMARTDLSVRIRDNAPIIREAVQYCTPDIVIFVGYQKNRENYRILKDREHNPFLAVMYASVDFIIRDECERYDIQHMYHCMDPTADFIRFLKNHYLM